MLDIRELFRHAEKYADQTVEIGGWVRTIRDTKAFGFIELQRRHVFQKCADCLCGRIPSPIIRKSPSWAWGRLIACKGTAGADA